jgi:predicted O-methyltransferase YrrM
MTRLLERIVAYARYYLKADTRQKIHSPFLFQLVESTFNSEAHYYDFDKIWQAWAGFTQRIDQIPPDSFGNARGQTGRTLGQFAKTSLHPPSRLYELYRLVVYLKPKRILELGSCLGVSSLTLGLAARQAVCSCIEGNAFFVELARELHWTHDIKNVRFYHHQFQDFLASDPGEHYDLIVLDGDHHYRATMDLLPLLYERLSPQGCLLVDDIHWSAGMARAWSDCLQNEKIRCSLETSRWGLIFKNKDLTPGHYVWCPEKWKVWQKYF